MQRQKHVAIAPKYSCLDNRLDYQNNRYDWFFINVLLQAAHGMVRKKWLEKLMPAPSQIRPRIAIGKLSNAFCKIWKRPHTLQRHKYTSHSESLKLIIYH